MNIVVRLSACLMIACLIGASCARADSGTGPFPTAVTPLSDLGNEAFRFTAIQWEELNWVLTLHRAPTDRFADGDITFYNGDQKIGWLTLRLKADEYDQLMRKVDATMAKGALETSVPKPPNSEVVVCADGDGFASERRSAGAEHWVSSSCSTQGNMEIRDLLLNTFQWRLVCMYRPVLGDCTPPQ
jgi:hypothetical protein